MQDKNTIVSIQDVVQQVLQGSLVIYPTETFFALGCDAFNVSSVQKIFSAKNRNVSQPLPLIVSSIKQAKEISSNVDEVSLSLMEQFWPGSLTLILPATERVPNIVTAGTGNIALRISSHAIAQKLVDACGVPLVSSSANKSGIAPVINIASLDESLLASCPIIISEGDAPAGGSPSTIVQVKNKKIIIKRKGVVTSQDLIHAGFSIEPAF